MSRSLGLYVHVPFCARKCNYCDFASWPGRQADMPHYVEAVCAEISRRGAAEGHPPADTVFFGGGTPSLLPPALYLRLSEALRKSFSLTPDAEWTVECNPGTLTEEFAAALRESGCNRVSLGMQAAQPRLLRALGRIHDMDAVARSAELLRGAGIEEINLDLMLGLPGQTLENMRETLRAALALRPRHISCYALIVEEGTPLQAAVARGEAVLPGEEMDRACYDLCRDTLAEAGLMQYEISNFALPGHECRHNVNCWRRQDYWGFGCAAHSLRHNVRFANPRGLDAYLAGEAAEREEIAPDEAMFEAMMLGLRLTEGVSEAAFEREYGKALWQVYGAALAPALRDGRLRREHGRVFLTRHGMDVMNSVLVALLPG